jgi:dihydrofolate reductase
MRKAALFMFVSMDGYFETEKCELDWHNVDAEFEEFSNAQLQDAGMLLFGRKTYDLMVGFWPKPIARERAPKTAEWMNLLPKMVFSRTLTKVDWTNTRIAREIDPKQVEKLKAEPGGELLVLGSNAVAVELLEKGLLDEARIMVNPVSLGRGHGLFRGLQQRVKAKSVAVRKFESGNVLLMYRW